MEHNSRYPCPIILEVNPTTIFLATMQKGSEFWLRRSKIGTQKGHLGIPEVPLNKIEPQGKPRGNKWYHNESIHPIFCFVFFVLFLL